ncbi:hypothetical protein ADUPG1_012973 [Aduncisulcus paluster]|uniref:Uncharacterized protein n=1 Tax=Aduncisulcus paluster TaxID=2918883 RepID=A0ABQ5K1A5_9EUKA|nr:hypothetical protein ADUPG1_012973 [Aduncisulcus paluster]
MNGFKKVFEATGVTPINIDAINPSVSFSHTLPDNPASSEHSGTIGESKYQKVSELELLEEDEEALRVFHECEDHIFSKAPPEVPQFHHPHIHPQYRGLRLFLETTENPTLIPDEKLERDRHEIMESLTLQDEQFDTIELKDEHYFQAWIRCEDHIFSKAPPEVPQFHHPHIHPQYRGLRLFLETTENPTLIPDEKLERDRHEIMESLTLQDEQFDTIELKDEHYFQAWIRVCEEDEEALRVFHECEDHIFSKAPPEVPQFHHPHIHPQYRGLRLFLETTENPTLIPDEKLERDRHEIMESLTLQDEQFDTIELKDEHYFQAWIRVCEEDVKRLRSGEVLGSSSERGGVREYQQLMTKYREKKEEERRKRLEKDEKKSEDGRRKKKKSRHHKHRSSKYVSK